jgi:hypothetical protein
VAARHQRNVCRLSGLPELVEAGEQHLAAIERRPRHTHQLAEASSQLANLRLELRALRRVRRALSGAVAPACTEAVDPLRTGLERCRPLVLLLPPELLVVVALRRRLLDGRQRRLRLREQRRVVRLEAAQRGAARSQLVPLLQPAERGRDDGGELLRRTLHGRVACLGRLEGAGLGLGLGFGSGFGFGSGLDQALGSP